MPTPTGQSGILLTPAKQGEKRVALVIVVSDYIKSGGAQSLPGARKDAKRIASAFTNAGFETEVALDLSLDQMRDKLTSFRVTSLTSDWAAIYTTGHGVEVNGTVFLLPGDYPITERNSAIKARALPLPEIAQTPSAKQANLIFYAGCRDNPFDR